MFSIACGDLDGLKNFGFREQCRLAAFPGQLQRSLGIEPEAPLGKAKRE
jgi:hypothetical protein